jgi:hypothetical protein
MVSMSEFLSGFSYHGEPVIQTGDIDPTRRRDLGRLKFPGGGQGAFTQAGLDKGRFQPFGLDPNDFVLGAPEIFARLLQTAELDGGFLSEVQQNRQFAEETSGLMGLLGTAERDRLRSASAANLNPVFAQRQNLESRFGFLEEILGRRAELGGELEERKFGAQEAFANMLAEAFAGEKAFKVNTLAALQGAEIGARGAREGGEAAGRGALFGGLATGAGALIGASI